MKKLLFTLFALCTVGYGQALNGADPCQSNGSLKSSAVINITTATTTALVAPVTGQAVYVCGFFITTGSTTTANTIQFEYGTGATCGGGTTVLSGTLNSLGALTGNITAGDAGQQIFSKVPLSNGVCALSTIGSTPSLQGFLTYVQQ